MSIIAGPIWINANAMLAYGLRDHGFIQDALEIARRVTAVLADDIRKSNTWHECYSAENGTGLAAEGFLSWNTMGATLLTDLATGKKHPLIFAP